MDRDGNMMIGFVAPMLLPFTEETADSTRLLIGLSTPQSTMGKLSDFNVTRDLFDVWFTWNNDAEEELLTY
jgi:hypothetical protein